MIPEGWTKDKAAAELAKIAKEAREFYKDKPHDGVAIDHYIGERWYKLCGATYVSPFPDKPFVPPPPKMTEAAPKIGHRSSGPVKVPMDV